MKIKDTFLNLTRKTYPYGYEDELVKFLPKTHFRDEHGNFYVQIGTSKTAFTSHFDTACKKQEPVTHQFEGHIVKTNGKTILGADDKAGVTVMLWMIHHKIEGLYCFFIGEEVGCIGSGAASNDDAFQHYERMISFDRRGTTSVITHQSSKRCCSDEFATELVRQLNDAGLEVKPDDGGVYTDSAEFVGVIPECTNISVGYYLEHTTQEHQDLEYLEKLCHAVLKVDWNNLPTHRVPGTIEWKKYTYTNTVKYPTTYNTTNPYRNDYWDEHYDSRSSQTYRKGKKSKSRKKRWEMEDDFDFVLGDKNDEDLEYYDRLYPKQEYSTKSKFEHLKQVIMKDDFTPDEYEIVREQYYSATDRKKIEDFSY